MRSLPALLAAISALQFFPKPAQAGVHVEDVDFLYIEPTVGAETLHLRLGSLDQALRGNLIGDDQTSTSLSLGALAGVRVGFLSVSVLLQRGSHTLGPAGSQEEAVADKVFGDLGFHARVTKGIAIAPHLSFGFAQLHSAALPEPLQGLGAKAGIAIELNPCSAISVGMRADADIQAYETDAMYSIAYGFTVAGSIGLHL